MTAPNPSEQYLCYDCHATTSGRCAYHSHNQARVGSSVIAAMERGRASAHAEPRFPNVEAMGVPVKNGYLSSHPEMAATNISTDFVLAADLEAALAKAPVENLVQTQYGWSTLSGGDKLGTHTGRILCVRENPRDTAESVLRDWVAKVGPYMDLNPREVDLAEFDRARKLLGGE